MRLFVILLLFLLPGIAVSLIPVTQDLFGADLGVPLAQFGWIQFFSALAGMAASFGIGPLRMRMDRKKTLVMSACAYVAGLVLFSCAWSFVILIFGYILFFFGASCAYYVAVTVLNERFAGRRRKFAGLSQAALALCWTVSPKLIEYLTRWAPFSAAGAWRMPGFVLAGLSLAALFILIFTKIDESSTIPPDALHTLHLLKTPRFLMASACMLLHSSADAAIVVWLVSFTVRSSDLARSEAVTILTCYIFGAFLGKVLISTLTRRIRSLMALTFSASLGGIFVFLTIFFGTGFYEKSILFGLAGLFIGMDFPSLLAYCGSAFPKEGEKAIGVAFGLLLIGTIFITAPLGWIAVEFGYGRAMCIPALAFLGVSITAAVLNRKDKAEGRNFE